MGQTRIRVLGVNHNRLMREGLSVLIGSQPDMELVGVAAAAMQAVHLYTEHWPDITLIDLNLCPDGGIRAIQEIRRIDPAACILGLTYDWDPLVSQALNAGAGACLSKDRLNEELLPLIRKTWRMY